MDFFLALWADAGNASGWSSILSTVWRVALVLLGINALIIVHEWGHFIVARMCGVRCEKFYIWFDAWGFRFFKFKWGDTEYGLGWLPLGGYVKMLGQEDNPGGIQAEIERARAELRKAREAENKVETVSHDLKSNNLPPEEQAAIAGAEEKVLEEEVDDSEKLKELEELEKQLYAPDSYLSKSVPQRMAIISAGVIMNVIFAIVCATAAVMLGFPETGSRIGSVLPGTPAWQNGIRPGDRIIEMNGTPVDCFSQIQIGLMDGQEVNVKLDRANVPEPVDLAIMPQITAGGMTPTIGITPSTSRQLAKIPHPYREEAKVVDSEKDGKAQLDALQGGDWLISMNGEKVESPADYEHLLRRFIAEPIRFAFESDSSKKEQRTVTLAPVAMKETGIRLGMGEIVSLQKGSPAEKAGLRATGYDDSGNVITPGDIIHGIDGEPVKDPLKLPYQFLRMTGSTLQGQPAKTQSVMLSVLRDGRMIEIPVIISSDSIYTGILSYQGNLAIGQLGISYSVKPIIGGVDTTVIFQKNAIENESGKTVETEANPLNRKIKGIKILLPKPAQDATDESKELYSSLARLGTPEADGIAISSKESGETAKGTNIVSWFCNYVNYIPVGTPIEVTVALDETKTTTVTTKVREAGDAFLVDRGLAFGVETTTRKAGSFGEALGYGWNKTVEMMGLVFKFLGNVGKTISAKALGGPVMIVNAAWVTAGSGDGLFLLFLCMIGANLAVVNFLPIPVLDGGHMVFLLYEAIFRRPPNETVQVVLSYMGLLLILALMFWVIALDLQRSFGGM